jgi:hypothetical protein
VPLQKGRTDRQTVNQDVGQGLSGRGHSLRRWKMGRFSTVPVILACSLAFNRVALTSLRALVAAAISIRLRLIRSSVLGSSISHRSRGLCCGTGAMWDWLASISRIRSANASASCEEPKSPIRRASRRYGARDDHLRCNGHGAAGLSGQRPWKRQREASFQRRSAGGICEQVGWCGHRPMPMVSPAQVPIAPTSAASRCDSDVEAIGSTNRPRPFTQKPASAE